MKILRGSNERLETWMELELWLQWNVIQPLKGKKILSYISTLLTLEDMIPSEISQSCEDKSYNSTFISTIWRFLETENRIVVVKELRKGKMESCWMYIVSVLQDEKFWRYVAQQCDILNTTDLHTKKWLQQWIPCDGIFQHQ